MTGPITEDKDESFWLWNSCLKILQAPLQCFYHKTKWYGYEFSYSIFLSRFGSESTHITLNSCHDWLVRPSSLLDLSFSNSLSSAYDSPAELVKMQILVSRSVLKTGAFSFLTSSRCCCWWWSSHNTLKVKVLENATKLVLWPTMQLGMLWSQKYS